MNIIKKNTYQNLTNFFLNGYSYRFYKRSLDIFCSSIALFVGLPLFLLISLLIKLDSPGPIIYKQNRHGQGRKIFWMYKFRSMPEGVEKEKEPVWAKENDPRSTKIGLYLRHWHLDELPQLINVLKGEMSLVGPRPERPYFVRQFKQAIADYEFRHRVKPGVTGWAQVNGYRGDTSVKERVKYDRFYIENRSLLFDLKILITTLFAKNKPWIYYPLTFSQRDFCLKNNPSQVPNKNA